MNGGFVYLLRADNGLVKIGRSSNPRERLKALGASPCTLTFLHQIATDDMVWLEKLLHARFAPKQVIGEWFRLEDGDLAELRVEVWNRPPGVVNGDKTLRYEMRADSEFCDQLEGQAERWGLSVAGYIRLAVNEKMERDRRRQRDEREEAQP